MDTARISRHQNHTGPASVDRNSRLESASAVSLPGTIAELGCDCSKKFFRRLNRKDVGDVIAFVSCDEAVYLCVDR